MSELTLEQLAAQLAAMDRRHDERLKALEQELMLAKMQLRRAEQGLADVLRTHSGIHERIANVQHDIARTQLALPEMVKSEVVFERLRERAALAKDRR